MSELQPKPDPGLTTFWGIFLRALGRWRPRRPVSLFLLVAMIVALLFGVQIAKVLDNPRQFAFLLSLYFVFFLVVIARATMDLFDVIREHVRDHEGVFRETFARDGFAQELGQHVAKSERGSWPDF